MDRFEAVLSISSTLPLSYLHSSMDRFEGALVFLKFGDCSYLHSSMDRFEGGTIGRASLVKIIFTFQYG